MTTECYAMVRGSAIRVTGLNTNGSLPDTIQFATSKAVSRVTINEVTESGGNEVLRNEDDERRLHFVKPDTTIRYLSDIDFLRVDPGILSLVTGVPLVLNASGEVVGFDANTRLPAKAFALEVWTKVSGETACAPAPVVGSGFGTGPFGSGSFGGSGVLPVTQPRWGYTLLPFLKGGVLSGFVFTNGLVSFNLRSAQTRRTAKWGYGPYDLGGPGERLASPVSGNTLYRSFLLDGIPPVQVDGIQTITDVIDGGDAGFTSPDVLDGEFVETSGDIVDGGGAAA